MKNLLYILIITFIGLVGCHTHEHANEIQELPTIAITHWTSKMELFMEYESAVVGNEIKFIIHLTTMEDFQPVREGKVNLQFKPENGTAIQFEKDALLREGIFSPIQVFKTPGEYDFQLSYQGAKANETFNIGKFTVYDAIENIPGEEESATDEISFLKEQQWKMDFATEEAQPRTIKSSIQAVGEVKPQPKSYAEIVSPVEGIISITEANQLVNPGQVVKKGQSLAVLVPPLSAQNSWAEIYLHYEQAKTEYDRAQRLKNRNAISAREFEEAQRNFEIQNAGFSNYFESEKSSFKYDSKNQRFTLTAPISGIVSNVNILPGQHVSQNQRLFSISDPSIVWLHLDLYSSQIDNFKDVAGATLRIPGKKEVLHIEKDKLKLISKENIIDPQTRTVDLWLEVKNNENKLMIGQTFNAQIYTGSQTEFLTIPSSAIFEDNAKKVVFIHSEGESFEKREIKLGDDYFGYTSILSGLESRERIVSRGGYMIKLASTSEEIGHAHTH